MKLRFLQNSVRLRLNRKEVDALAAGTALQEEVYFPGNSRVVYLLEPFGHGVATASFAEGVIRIAAPGNDIKEWATSDSIGLYFHLPTGGAPLKVAIEKDLECLDGPAEERDPMAFTRATKTVC